MKLELIQVDEYRASVGFFHHIFSFGLISLKREEILSEPEKTKKI
jgi:hypothetical protein